MYVKRGTRVIYNSRTGIFSHQSYMFLSLLDSMNRRFEFSSRKVVVADVRRERSKSMEPFFGELHYHESSSATITRLEMRRIKPQTRAKLPGRTESTTLLHPKSKLSQNSEAEPEAEPEAADSEEVRVSSATPER